MNRKSFSARSLFAVLSIAVAPQLHGQAAPASAASSATPEEEDVITLSPFVVEETEGSGSYQATSTLAGTRIRTDLKDLATPITVMTKQFLDDVGAVNNQSLLTYTPNTEITGLNGNFSNVSGQQNFSENLGRPHASTRVRGLDAADNTRDYFLTEIPWDGYNVDRIDLQRGPNSILFGLGSPAGIINASVNTANFKNGGKFENRYGQFGSLRNSIDYNHVLLPDQLAVRFAGMVDKTEFRQDPAYKDDRRAFGTVKWRPQFFGEENRTEITANFESGRINANYPRTLPPVDYLSPWFGTLNGSPGLNKLTVNPGGDRERYAQGGTEPNPWFPNEAFMGNRFGPDITVWYDGPAAAGPALNPNAGGPTPRPNNPSSAYPGDNTNRYGLGADGTVDFGIGDFPAFRAFAIAGYNQYGRSFPGGAYYSDYVMTDTSVFDFEEKLLDGPNKSETEEWQASNIAISQSFLNDRLSFQAVYDYQRYENGGRGSGLGGRTYGIQVDINTHNLDGSTNTNLGRPYVAGTGGGNRNFSDRDGWRFTGVGEVRGSDFIKNSRFAEIIGRNVFTAIYSHDLRRTENRNWTQTAVEPLWAETIDVLPNITQNARAYDWVRYLGPSLLDASSASGANISNIVAQKVTPEDITIKYFDSHWNAPGVNPGDPYQYTNSLGVLIDSTQAENRANYVGWTTKTFHLLDADRGDIDSLYSPVQKNIVYANSRALTWQGYLVDGLVVPTVGWREDTIKGVSETSPSLPLAVGTPNFPVIEREATATDRGNISRASGNSVSWGVVAHLPQFLAEKLPGGTNISVFYNSGENFKADAPRADVQGDLLANPSAESKDYGFTIRTLHDRLTFKMNWYETKNLNATLSAGASGGFGGNGYYLWAVPAWGVTHALNGYEGVNGRNPGNAWMWNYASAADRRAGGTAQDNDPDWQPGTPNFDNHPATIKQKEAYADFFANMPLTQSFWDAYGLDVNAAGLMSSNPLNGWPTYQTAALDMQPRFGGRIGTVGQAASATADTTSKGLEIELTARPVKNWNVTLNVAKTEATLSAVSPTVVDFIETYTEFLAADPSGRGTAGDVILWGTDPNNSFRNYWRDNILNAWGVLQSRIGQKVPELAKWKFSSVSTYNFVEGRLAGLFVGGAYRWEDRRAIGFQPTADLSSLDSQKPWLSPREDHIDLWVGYNRDLSDKVRWRIQVNLRNVGENTRLIPVTRNPDGSNSVFRIAEGLGWTITNSLTF